MEGRIKATGRDTLRRSLMQGESLAINIIRSLIMSCPSMFTKMPIRGCNVCSVFLGMVLMDDSNTRCKVTVQVGKVPKECENFVFAGDAVATFPSVSHPSGSAKIEFSHSNNHLNGYPHTTHRSWVIFSSEVRISVPSAVIRTTSSSPNFSLASQNG